jgi:hypothetical protein
LEAVEPDGRGHAAGQTDRQLEVKITKTLLAAVDVGGTREVFAAPWPRSNRCREDRPVVRYRAGGSRCIACDPSSSGPPRRRDAHGRHRGRRGALAHGCAPQCILKVLGSYFLRGVDAVLDG